MTVAAGLGTAAPIAIAGGGGGVALAPSAKDRARHLVVRKISCWSGCTGTAAKPGALLRFQGPLLKQGRRVVYLGGAGTQDDVVAALRPRRSGRTTVLVATLPQRAHSGPVAIEIGRGARSPASTVTVTVPGQKVLAADLAPIAGTGPFFPVRGDHTFGTGAAAFGGGRHHQGQDVFADCGTPLVAAEGGTVLANAFHARAGNYVVIDVDGGERDEMYAHLKAPALPIKDAHIAAGTPLGEVGDTGRADGCHLHFELWQGHWQGVGGQGTPIDPLPTLRSWAAGSAVRAAAR